MFHPTSLAVSSFSSVVLGLVGWLAAPAAAADVDGRAGRQPFRSRAEGLRLHHQPGRASRRRPRHQQSRHWPAACRLACHRSPVGSAATRRRDGPAGRDGRSAVRPHPPRRRRARRPRGWHRRRSGWERRQIQVRLRVGGPLKPSLAVEHLRIDYAGTPNPFAKGDATVSYTIRNTGNATLAARQTLSVSGPFGRWAVAAPRIADSPALLPGARGRYPCRCTA